MTRHGHATRVTREFDDNALLQMLFGPHNANLDRIEQELGVELHARGNAVTIAGAANLVQEAEVVLSQLYDRLLAGNTVETSDIDTALRMSGHKSMAGEDLTLHTRKRHITPRSPTQADYIRSMNANELVCGLGPAGTGKTYMAVAKAVSMMIKGQVDRIVLSRPAVEAGERLGFLPGDLREKVDPYLRPLYDALYDMLPGDQVMKRLSSGEIEVAPLAFMRGRTLANSFIILDEAQNTSPMQMKMFLTRLGEHSRMVVTGDLSQIDLPAGTPSGLKDCLEILSDVDGVGVVRFTEKDVVRHNLVTRIVVAYDERDRRRKDGGEAKRP